MTVNHTRHWYLSQRPGDGFARMTRMSFRPGLETIRFHRLRIKKRDERWSIALRRSTTTTDATTQRSTEQLCYRTAFGRQDLESAFQLLHRRYCAAGLSQAYDRRLRILPFHFWRQTQVFVAKQGSDVLGCITLVTDSGDHSLPIESYYPESIRALHRQGERTGEITCLAMEPNRTESSSRLFGELTRRTMFFARARGLTRLTAVVHPRHAKFYCHAMGFEVIGEPSRQEHVEGLPGVPILGSVNDPTPYRERWRQFYFEGTFPSDEIAQRPMSQIDQEYFRRHLDAGVYRSNVA